MTGASTYLVLGTEFVDDLLGEYRLQFLGSESEETGFDSEYIWLTLKIDMNALCYLFLNIYSYLSS